MIGITVKGDGKKTIASLEKLRRGSMYANLDRYGQMGVEALSARTPVETSETAHSWGYRIIRSSKEVRIEWYNTHMAGRVSVAVLLQYGHATGTGGYVAGRDFINPAMRPVFDMIADEVWKKVKSI